jgi:hypothetical protein
MAAGPVLDTLYCRGKKLTIKSITQRVTLVDQKLMNQSSKVYVRTAAKEMNTGTLLRLATDYGT